jgi:hypothetical protein
LRPSGPRLRDGERMDARPIPPEKRNPLTKNISGLFIETA